MSTDMNTMYIGTKVKFLHEGKQTAGYILEVKNDVHGNIATVRVGRNRLIGVSLTRLTKSN